MRERSVSNGIVSYILCILYSIVGGRARCGFVGFQTMEATPGTAGASETAGESETPGVAIMGAASRKFWEDGEFLTENSLSTSA